MIDTESRNQADIVIHEQFHEDETDIHGVSFRLFDHVPNGEPIMRPRKSHTAKVMGERARISMNSE